MTERVAGMLRRRAVVRDDRKEGAWLLLSRVAPYRGPLELSADIVAWLVAIYAAAMLRFDFDLSRWEHTDLLIAVAIAATAQAVVGSAIGLYRKQWRFGSFEEVAALVCCVAVVTAITLVVSHLVFTMRLVPSSVAVGGGLVALVTMSGVRYSWRLFVDRLRRPSADVAARVVVFGAGEAGEQLVTAMLRNPDSPMCPVALLDDDTAKHRYRIKGVPVLGGRDHIAEVATAREAERLVIAVPSGSPALFRELSHRGIEAGLDVAVLPPMEDFLNGESEAIDVSDVRPIDVRDFLGRPQVQTDIDQVAGYVTDRRVLVTGAGGSIGSELCRQLNRLAPAELVMLDRDESALHAVQLSIEGRALLDTPNLVVADIRDRGRMAEVFSRYRPEVVFHAAALKHLPLLEMHPAEGYKTNVFGTLNLLELSAEHCVERFVNVSTDKAADPCSVLGHTKRLAEQLTAHIAEDAAGTFLSVRFGNVLGSRGSVLETFKAQIEVGGPVTVVHPDVTRYFMVVEEAVELVIQAGAIGEDGEALVLDMGDPVSIEDVARQMIANADRRIEIVYTGLRPGEKLHEVLVGADEVVRPGCHPLISHLDVEPISPAEVSQLIAVG